MTHPARSEQTLLIVFADITRFVHHARGVEDLELAEMLDGYYKLVEDLALHASGQILKFMGDGFLAVWLREQIAAGLDALPILKREIDAWWANHHWDSRLVIRAHVGSAVLGPYGNEGRLDAIGNAVNKAATLPARTISLSSDAWLQLAPEARAAYQAQAGGSFYTPKADADIT
jgi:class 3 adenylate cyclase